MRLTELINLLRDNLAVGHSRVLIKHSNVYHDFELAYDRNGNLIFTNLRPIDVCS